MMKVKVGSLMLTEARDVNLPQEYAAYYQTVRVEPGTYDVHAYIDWTGDGGGGMYWLGYRIHSLSAQCEGITIASHYGKAGDRNGQRSTAFVELPTYGRAHDDAKPSLLAQSTLCDALVRTEWDPGSGLGRMWRFTWKNDVKVKQDVGKWISGQTIAAQIEEG